MINKNEVIKNIISYWNKKQPFRGIIDIPDYPLFNSKVVPNAENLQRWIAKRFVELGALPKDKLIIGHSYRGHSRNTTKAKWKGDYFEYERTKFGCTYTDKINHFEDDNEFGYDVFVPLYDIDWVI